MILAIDSSGLVASVALVEKDRVLAEYTTNQKKTHSQTLLPMIDEIFKMTEVSQQEVEGIAVSAGPGSFTGLRIGSATAKGLAMAWEKPIIPVDTLAALAYNIQYTDALICPIMDARRSQVYTGIYENRDGIQHIQMKQTAMGVEALTEYLSDFDKSVIFLGDGVPVYRSMIDEKLSAPHYYAPPHMNRQRAAAVGVLGGILYEEGKWVTADEHAPEYLRMSQAERERLQHG